MECRNEGGRGGVQRRWWKRRVGRKGRMIRGREKSAFVCLVWACGGCYDIMQRSTKIKKLFCYKKTNAHTHSGGKSGKPTSKPSGARKKPSSFVVVSPVKKATSLEEKYDRVEKPDHGASSPQKVRESVRIKT